MGQSASSQRDREDFLNRDSRRFSQIIQNRGNRQVIPSRSGGQPPTTRIPSATPLSTQQVVDPNPPQPIATFSRQISAQSTPAVRGGTGNSPNISTRDDIFYEQHEERPLANLGDMEMRNAPITHITASPMPRRPNRIARISSLMIPRYAATGSSGNNQPTRGEGRSLRRRLSNSQPLSTTSEGGNRQTRRSSFLRSPSSRYSAAPRSGQRRELAPISRPFPLDPDASFLPTGFTTSSLRETQQTRNASADSSGRSSRFWSLRDNSHLSRVRRSISFPFEAIFPSPQGTPVQDRSTQTPPQRPSRFTPVHDPEFQLPPLNVAGPTISLDESTLGSPSPVHLEQRLSGISAVSESPEDIPSRTNGSSRTERRAERGSVGSRETRRMPNMLRGRSTRLIRRDNEGPLPRILHLAATAIAAQLSGTSEQPVPSMQAVGPDDLDGSLQNLFRTLQNASTLTGDLQNHEDNPDSSRQDGALPPLNFLRVFRFVSQAPNTERVTSSTRTSETPAIESNAEEHDGRTVTLVVVGVRSVPLELSGREDASAPEPNFESLLNLQPPTPSTSMLRNGASGLLRHANGRARFPHRRRASIGALNTFPANYDSQRHQRALSSSSVRGSLDATGSPVPLVLSESSPGPNPPPSTPADPGFSAHSSAATTPSRRPSSASAIQQPQSPYRDLASQHLREAVIPSPDQQVNRVQHQRRSDSEFARHRDLGAGAARRNGVVEPDGVDPGDIPASGSRSWLIYVVGTNLSEDHPALTTPSLFTDNPTYEDMLLLSSLLGPAKPPVASHEDVASASGIYQVQRNGEVLIAVAVQGLGQVRIASTERCLVCLENYQAEEELRQLTKCSHLFHRECIDQWLTTGRNSCPLCRGQGVDEKEGQSQNRQSSLTSHSGLVS